MSPIASPTVYVTYNGAPGERFDRSYYLEHHLPLVMQAWRRYGLEHVAAFFRRGRMRTPAWAPS